MQIEGSSIELGLGSILRRKFCMFRVTSRGCFVSLVTLRMLFLNGSGRPRSSSINFLMLTQEVSLNRAKSYREKQHVLGIAVLQIDAEVIRY